MLRGLAQGDEGVRKVGSPSLPATLFSALTAVQLHRQEAPFDKSEGGHTSVIELKPDGKGDFYDVITGLICRRKSIQGKVKRKKIRLLWQKP